MFLHNIEFAELRISRILNCNRFGQAVLSRDRKQPTDQLSLFHRLKLAEPLIRVETNTLTYERTYAQAPGRLADKVWHRAAKLL